MGPKKGRVWATIVYLIALVALHYAIINPSLLPGPKEIWLFNGIASLVLGSRLLNPHFTPPADAATNAFVAGGTMIAALATAPAAIADLIVVWSAIAICALVFLLSVALLLIREPSGRETRVWVLGLDRLARGVGSPTVIFTGVIIASVWLFHRESMVEVFAILTAWTTIVALRPVDAAADLLSWLREHSAIAPSRIAGLIAAYQAPGLVLLRQSDDAHHKRGTLMLIGDAQGPTMLGAVINYVGRDEGHLLRLLSLPMPPAFKDVAAKAGTPTGCAQLLSLTREEQQGAHSVLDRIGRLCGIVDSGTTLGKLEFEVVDDKGLAEGRLVEVKIGGETTLYQLIDGVTHEELVQQKNKYGYARARARKIGKWDEKNEKFEPVRWLPRINAPVFLEDSAEYTPRASAIGHFPETNYTVSIDPNDAVTHNTAILGILGIGKSYLAIELVERAVAQGVKILCLDLTDQYANMLAPFVVAEREQRLDEELRNAGAGRPADPNAEEGGSHLAFREAVREQLRQFMAADNPHPIRILNPSRFVVSKQTNGWNQQTAGFGNLSPAEITAIFSQCALEACQDLGMTDRARLCLVYEEAHSLVPEWNSIASKGDDKATAASASAILQGRKYGLGCFLITQRTANVTKTILNQCNTIFAMRTFDDTGKEFLSNYIGGDYAGLLSSLQPRHAVFFGKASSCDDPVLLRLNDREEFEATFRAEHAPPVLPDDDGDDGPDTTDPPNDDGGPHVHSVG